MKSQADIEALGSQKLKEAEALLAAGLYDGAFYLGGYCVELLLKAKVCKTLRINDFFLFKAGKPEMYKPYKSHDYDQLLIFSGLYGDFVALTQSNPQFKAHWSVVCTWKEDSRYLTGKSIKDAKSFLTSIIEVSKWIKSHL